MIDVPTVRGWIPSASATHKDQRGRVLVVGGSARWSGAPLLAGHAAMRCGAGVATLAVPRSLVLALAGRVPELTFLALPESQPGLVDPGAARHVADAIAERGFRALVVGPGLSRDEAARRFVLELCGRMTLPSVIDASALNALAATPGWPSRLPRDAVLTPHLGEARRLAAGEVGEDRVSWTRERAGEWKATLLLKGPCTVVASPSGDLFTHDRPNPALATAGSGDVLAGCIGAFLAQGLDPFRAACVGTLVHGEAGALVAREVGETGALASDQIDRLPRAIAALR